MPDRSPARLTTVAGTSISAAYLWYYLSKVCKAPQLYFKDGPLSRLVLEHCQILQEPFCPTPWAFDQHTQTMLSVGRQFWRVGQYRRQALVTPDGGLIALDWYQGCDTASHIDQSVPVLLVFHGLTGGSREGYCKAICAAAAKQGWRAAVLNYRGCAGLPMTAPKCYSATFTDDVHFGIEEVQRRFPDAPLFAAGYSLGALILTKYLAEADTGKWPGQGSGIKCAALVSSPTCLSKASDNLQRPWTLGRLYNLILAVRLKSYFKEHEHQMSQHATLDALTEAWTIAHFDKAVVCKVFGYDSVEDYYKHGSSEQYIPHITSPTLFLVAEDDPFMGRLPIKECSSNPNTILAVTSRGGHVAFLQGLWPFAGSWSDDVVISFFQACHAHSSQLPERQRPQQRSRM
ncbi:Phospholipase ABHD3 [Coccomyxa sp. Obi]|nr:Phospholipase ABHD3 [Coccomyxa sp. Obi]